MQDSETAVELPPERAAELAREGVRLVDVRNRAEHEAAHIPGDELIPFDELKDRAAELGGGSEVVLYCRSGDRSGAAAQALRASGWDAYSIEGGLLAWRDKGLPIEPANGEIIEPSSLPPA